MSAAILTVVVDITVLVGTDVRCTTAVWVARLSVLVGQRLRTLCIRQTVYKLERWVEFPMLQSHGGVRSIAGVQAIFARNKEMACAYEEF